MIPEQPSLTNFVVSKDSKDVVVTALQGPKNVIPPGQSGSFRYVLYVGPKEYNRLQAQNVGLEKLPLTLDHG